MAKVNTQETVAAEEVVATVSSAEKFFSENKKYIWCAVIAVVVVALGVLGYSKFVYAPACAEAQEAMFPSEFSFQQGDYELALNGDGNVLGFAEVASQYGSKAGQSVYLYAGICCAQLGKYDEALTYLKKYNGKDPILAARALALRGDCLAAGSDLEGAAKMYTKAAAKADNVFAASYLVKLGQTYLALGKNAEAKKAFQTVAEKYPDSIEGYEIDKYLNLVTE